MPATGCLYLIFSSFKNDLNFYTLYTDEDSILGVQTMKYNIFILCTLGISLAACSAGGGAQDSGVTKPQQPSVSPSTGDSSTITPPSTPSTTNAGDSKCWAKILDTPEYTACKGATKLYNRVLKTCIELGITRKSDCSDIPAQSLADAKTRILAALPASSPDVDQCGTYNISGTNYIVAFIMGKKFTETAGSGSYKTQHSLICVAPQGNSTTCNHGSLKLTGAPPSSNQLDCN
jgi:hypothetical protein